MCYTWVPYALAAVQAKQQYDQGVQDEQVAEYNSRLLENQATQTRNKGIEEENKQRRHTAELLSQQRAAAGASGLDIESGSLGQIQDDTVMLGEVDALRIRSNFRDEAQSLDDRAAITLQQGRASKKSKGFAATATVLGAGLNSQKFASKWYSPTSVANL